MNKSRKIFNSRRHA